MNLFSDHIMSSKKNYYTIRIPESLILPELTKDELRDDQFELAKNILSKSNALICAYTGFGKSYLMVYLLKYLPKPIIITAPSYAILEEFSLRLKDKEIPFSFDIEDESEVTLLNPTGTFAKNNFKNGVYDNFLSKVKTLLTDECMSMPMSLDSLISKLTSCERFYGFSATPEKVSGKDLMNPKDFTLSDEACKILSIYGKAINSITLPKLVNLYTTSLPLIKSNLTYKTFCKKTRVNDLTGEEEEYVDENMKFVLRKMILKKVMTNNIDRISNYLIRIHDFVRSTIYIPYLDKKDILPYLISLGKSKKVGIWNSEGLFLNSNEKFPKKEAYVEVKNKIQNNDIDFIFCSTIGKLGVDFPGLQNIVLFCYSGYGPVIQAIGRCARTDNPINVFIPVNTLGCEVFDSQTYARIANIKKLENVNEVKFEI